MKNKFRNVAFSMNLGGGYTKALFASIIAGSMLVAVACNKEEITNSNGTPSALVANSISEKETNLKIVELKNQLGEDASLQMLSILPIGGKTITAAADAIEQDLNKTFSSIPAEKFQGLAQQTFELNITTEAGNVSIVEQQRWLLQAALNVTNILINDLNEAIPVGIDVKPIVQSPRVVTIVTTVYTPVSELLPGLARSCVFPTGQTINQGLLTMQALFNSCQSQIAASVGQVINVDQIEYLFNSSSGADNVNGTNRYWTSGTPANPLGTELYLFSNFHPFNDGNYTGFIDGEAILSKQAWDGWLNRFVGFGLQVRPADMQSGNVYCVSNPSSISQTNSPNGASVQAIYARPTMLYVKINNVLTSFP